MGQSFSHWFFSIFKYKDAKILMVGLDAAGKTSILYKLKLDENIVTVPTIGFNVETIQYNNIRFSIWDIGGQDRIRQLWNYYYDGNNAIIYVIDSNDKERMEEAKNELHHLISDDRVKDCILLILANKQDLPYAISISELIKILKLKEINQKWLIQPCCAISGEGLYDGFDWLSKQLK